MSPKKEGKKRVINYLEPITSRKKRRKFVVYDIESKHDDTQVPGFTRPFLVGFYDPQALKRKRGPNAYQEFRNEPHLSERGWERRHIMPGGCIDKFLNIFLSKRYNKHTAYAHNGGNFDHLFALAWLEEHRDEYGFEVVPVQSSIQMIRIWRRPKNPEDPIKVRWEMLDSYKLLPFGLDKACATFGLPGKEGMNLSTHEDDPIWSVYLKQDCIALATVLMKTTSMIEDLGGEVGITTPSTAMRLFRRKYMGQDGVPEKIPRWLHFPRCAHKLDGRCFGCAHDWIRRGYYGGRTEIFRFEGAGLRYYDINSSYVASMKQYMPIGDRLVEEGVLDWRKHHSTENPKGHYSGFCECEVYIPLDCPVPPLPHKNKETGKLTFPSGLFNGVWSVEELALLKDPFVKGEIRKVRRTIWFRLLPMFRQMVEALWKLRDKKRPEYDKGLDELAKLLGNSTYGKFAMKQLRASVVFTRGDGLGGRAMEQGKCFLCGELEEDEEPVSEGGICGRCVGSKPAMKEPEGEVWYKANRSDASYIIPQVAAHITAWSRIMLWRYMKMAVELGGQVYYSDSVTGDRTTVIRNSRGLIEILPLEELWSRGRDLKSGGTKERRALAGYEALSHVGWSSIKQIIRHRSGKPTHRVSMKDGQTQVTPDHGIMVDGKEVGPERFVEQKMSFSRATVPRAVVRDEIDLYDFVKDYVYEKEIGDMCGPRPEHQIVRTVKRKYRFEADKDWIWLVGKGGDTKDLNSDRIRRRYKKGSKELHTLLRLTGAYVSDGSVSLPGSTTSTRFMFSLCKSDLPLMKQLASDLETMVPHLTITGPMWTETVYVVRSGTAQMALLFDALMGHGHLNKKLPSFVYDLSASDFEVLLKAFEDGDGGREPVTNAFLFTSTSQRLMAGVSYLLSQHGYEHAFHFRPSKGAWSVRTRPTGSARKGRVPTIGHEVFESKTDEYVYDLSVEGSHTFVDGIGQVLLHNTDSIITDVELPCSTNLGEMKAEHDGDLLEFVSVQPKVYMIKNMRLNSEIALRREVLEGALAGDESYDASTLDVSTRVVWEGDVEIDEKKGVGPGYVVRSKDYDLNFHAKVTMKGFPPRVRTADNLAILRGSRKLEWQQLEKVRSLARKGFKNPPRMRDVEKSFRSTYDKRETLPDGGTRSLVLNDPMLDEETPPWPTASGGI